MIGYYNNSMQTLIKMDLRGRGGQGIAVRKIMKGIFMPGVVCETLGVVKLIILDTTNWSTYTSIMASCFTESSYYELLGYRAVKLNRD